MSNRTDKEEREVRRYRIGAAGMEGLEHWSGPVEVILAADYDAANQRIRQLEEERNNLIAETHRWSAAEKRDKEYYRQLETELNERYSTLQQQTQQLVVAVENFAGACDCIFDDGGTIKGHLREALKPFQKGEANEA